jgi:hypothetical protein
MTHDSIYIVVIFLLLIVIFGQYLKLGVRLVQITSLYRVLDYACNILTKPENVKIAPDGQLFRMKYVRNIIARDYRKQIEKLPEE